MTRMKPNTPMKRLFAVLAACAAFCCALEAQTPQPLYPDGPERSSGIDPASTVDRDGVLFNVTVPDYYVFLPERERAVGQMVVVCPGGGYGCVCYEREGLEVARWLGDHGIAVMSQREGLAFSTTIESDAAPLNHLIAAVLDASPHVRCFRDPTRGGLASTLNEFAAASNVEIEVDEEAIPVKPEVQAACEMLGYDPLQVANEGKIVAVVPADEAAAALEAMRANRYGADAAIIGRVRDAGESGPRVRVRTPWGSTRILDMLVGEQLPRIC